MGELFLGTAAGALTTLSPCVLPVLPFVVLAALDQHRFGPLALAAGMTVTFAAIGLAVFATGWALGYPGDSIRAIAAALMALFGALLLSAALHERFAAAGAPLTAFFNRTLERISPRGLQGQFGLGALLGAVWSPCSGPTLGAAVTLAASTATLAQAGGIMLLFGMGASLPLLALAYGSRQTLKARRDGFLKIERAARPALGVILIGTGLLVFFGFDRALEQALVSRMPDWLVSLTTRY
jgi:cytochrome c-type biogenesis protein